MLYTTKVLIADEDTIFTQSLCQTLTKDGNFSVSATHTGNGLLEVVRNSCPDILILDFMLPNVNILNLLQELHDFSDEQRPCIFVLSAFASTEMTTECNRLGVNFFLRKPVSISGLAELIERYGIRISIPSKPTKHEMMLHITDLLNHLQFPTHVMGYRYVRDSIYMALNEPSSVDSVTKILYPSIAKKYRANWTSVERDIRNAVSIAWNRSNSHFPGFNFSSRPANREFIFTLAERISFDLQIDTFANVAQ